MADAWEESFWLVTTITNSVLGFHIIFRCLLSSWYPLSILATINTVFLVTIQSFSQNYRHENYFKTKTKTKIMRCVFLEIGIVAILELVFFELGYRKWISPVAWVAYVIPALVPKPCRIPDLLIPVPDELYIILYLTGIVLWGFRYEKDWNYVNQFIIGAHLVGQSSLLIAYHLYKEVDRHMHDAGYYVWLLHQIRRGTVYRSQMMVDLFMARGMFP